ncbi:MAG: pyroglutamyl-peptidase I [Methylobacterium mesophilicum]|nr:pyroglutamyl-peptidase I [Methylobacterium mesophilicum]
MEKRGRPRVLVTGFGSFPGVPANPTEELIRALRAECGEGLDFRCELLAVEYQSVPQRLEALGAEFEPDIAIHFGVSRNSRAFDIETVARNAVCTVKPDNAGYVPRGAAIRAGEGALRSTLPVETIRLALEAQDLPVALSDDAGDYLCNFIFYLSRGMHVPPFAPKLAGFIHVPPFDTELVNGERFSLDLLRHGARIVVETCIACWRDA